MAMNRLYDLGSWYEIDANRPVPVAAAKNRLPVVGRCEDLVAQHQPGVEARAADLLHAPRVVR